MDSGETTKLIESGKVGWTKRLTTCQLRPLGNPVVNVVCMPFDADATASYVAVVALARETQAPKLMNRSDDGTEVCVYYRRGHSSPIGQVEPHTVGLMTLGGRSSRLNRQADSLSNA